MVKGKAGPKYRGNPVLQDKFREDKSGKETGCFKKFFGQVSGHHRNSTADLQKIDQVSVQDDWDDWPP